MPSQLLLIIHSTRKTTRLVAYSPETIPFLYSNYSAHACATVADQSLHCLLETDFACSVTALLVLIRVYIDCSNDYGQQCSTPGLDCAKNIGQLSSLHSIFTSVPCSNSILRGICSFTVITHISEKISRTF